MSENVETKQVPKNVWSGEDRSFRILRRVSLDCLSGILAALTLSPIVAAVDKAVVETSSGSKTVLQSLKGTVTSMVKSPVKFFASVEFRWIYLVYSSTYMTNNSIDSLCKVFQISDVVPKLVGVTAVNMTASILKDRAFAIYFGKKGSTKVAPISMLIWLLRDVISMAVAFVLPMRFAAYLQTRDWSEGTSKKFAQFSLPMFSQLFLTPVHLLGYDYYNFPVRSIGERAQYIKGIYGPTAVVRIFRMGSAYGVGGVSNITLRNKLISSFEGKDWDKSYK